MVERNRAGNWSEDGRSVQRFWKMLSGDIEIVSGDLREEEASRIRGREQKLLMPAGESY